MSAAKERKASAERRAVGSIDAYSIPEFCRRHNISVGSYYALRKLCIGPRELRVLGRVLISRESAEAWRRVREEVETA
jgi:hypothetical protein